MGLIRSAGDGGGNGVLRGESGAQAFAGVFAQRVKWDSGVVGDEPYVAKGAAVIRNSVIKRWLDTVGVSETVRRAGLKREASLRLRPTGRWRGRDEGL